MLDNRRRGFLKDSLATGAIGAAWAAGIINPQVLLADWPKAAFDAEDVPTVIKGLGAEVIENDPAIQIKAPEIAENGAVVPITVETSLADVSQIVILAAVNKFPLAADFRLTPSVPAELSTRIKMNKSGKVVALVQAGGKLYTAEREVKVTIGGCGG